MIEMSGLSKNMNQSETDTALMVQTSRFGEIAVDPERIITLVSPLLGFPESIRFILRPHSQKSPFVWLQSLDNPDLAFVVIPASLINTDYRPAVSPQILKELQFAPGQEQELLLILTIPKDNPEKMTANLLGPVVLNSSRRLAAQIVLDPNKYDPCQPLFPQK